jgi:hypothetical protein
VLRPFTEPALSEILQSLRSFRMTESEGFRVTKKGFFNNLLRLDVDII